jgi:hypothetical protein
MDTTESRCAAMPKSSLPFYIMGCAEVMFTELEKQRARSISSAAILMGKIKKHDDCYLCGTTENVIAHHPDYELPLLVIWLCRSCHMRIHIIKQPRTQHEMTDGWTRHLELMQQSKVLSHGSNDLFWKNYNRLKRGNGNGK